MAVSKPSSSDLKPNIVRIGQESGDSIYAISVRASASITYNDEEATIEVSVEVDDVFKNGTGTSGAWKGRENGWTVWVQQTGAVCRLKHNGEYTDYQSLIGNSSTKWSYVGNASGYAGGSCTFTKRVNRFDLSGTEKFEIIVYPSYSDARKTYDKCEFEVTLKNVQNLTPVGVPNITIIDNYDNTFTINATKGANGTNNPAKGLTNLYWGYSQEDVANKKNSYTVGGTKDLTISGTGNTRTVYAGAATIATYGDNHGKISDPQPINQYLKPNNPGKPVISYTKSRFTPKERILYRWAAATAKNGPSKVVGYRVRLYQQKAGTTTWNNIPIWSTTSNTQKSKLLNGEYVYDRQVDDPTYISLGHEIHGFEVGDKVKLSIQAYSRFGKNSDGDNSELLSDKIESAETEIQSAGTMHVKVGDKWEEGQVYVKVNDKWEEAESVHIKTSTGWAEST